MSLLASCGSDSEGNPGGCNSIAITATLLKVALGLIQTQTFRRRSADGIRNLTA